MRTIILAMLLSGVPVSEVFGSQDCSQSPLRGSKQVILVISPHWNSKEAAIQRFTGSTRVGWKPSDSEPFHSVLGRNGMGWGDGLNPKEAGSHVKHEGDGRAPAGVFPLTQSFGYHSSSEVGFRSASHLPYLQVDKNSRCVDDTKSGFYNLVVPDQTKVSKDWNSDEGLHRTDDLYEYAVVVGHNGIHEFAHPSLVSPTVGDGSCIFMHSWRPAAEDGTHPGTAGCTAMSKEHIREIAGWLDPSDKPLLVQLPLDEYVRLKDQWCLPEVESTKWLTSMLGDSEHEASDALKNVSGDESVLRQVSSTSSKPVGDSPGFSSPTSETVSIQAR